MIVVDTSVLVYALGSEHPLREPARALLARSVELTISTTIEVIEEFVHVHARRHGRDAAAARAALLVSALDPFPTSVASVDVALEMFRSCGDLGAFDCFLIAAAAEAGAGAVVSADAGFSSQDLVPVVPLKDAVDLDEPINAGFVQTVRE